MQLNTKRIKRLIIYYYLVLGCIGSISLPWYLLTIYKFPLPPHIFILSAFSTILAIISIVLILGILADIKNYVKGEDFHIF